MNIAFKTSILAAIIGVVLIMILKYVYPFSSPKDYVTIVVFVAIISASIIVWLIRYITKKRGKNET